MVEAELSGGSAHTALLRRAARVLPARLPELTDRLVAELQALEPAYLAGGVPPDELWQSAHEALRVGVAALAVWPRELEGSRWASGRLARRRAEQGVPLEALLHAYRLGGVLLWQTLVEVAAEQEPDEVRLLVHVATDVWNFVDGHAGAIADAYRRVEAELTNRHDERVHALLDTLLDGRAPAADLAAAAAVLDLPERGRYAVVALRHPFPGTGVHDAPRRPAPDGVRVVWRARMEGEFAVVLLGTAGLDEVAETFGPATGSRAGISAIVDGLAALGRARRLAEIALRTCTADGECARLDERLPAALVASQPDLAHDLAARVLGPILALDPVDRDLLLGTLGAWLDCGGSAVRAGRRLFCHRNTVLNRLRRLEQLTGRELGLPRDLVELALALDAHRLRT
ncbi:MULTISPECIES: helix-turn-helix domain-containing protein [unclassified Embleya]|uniref:PucR family transcriptional regulator n=1 Tax=unclassified Embleya TaxID=2699296 RepID=UPI0034093997